MTSLLSVYVLNEEYIKQTLFLDVKRRINCEQTSRAAAREHIFSNVRTLSPSEQCAKLKAISN